MAATRQDIQEWFELGVKQNSTHLIVVCDTFDHDDYPVYISADQDVKTIESNYNGKNMQRVMEVYNLKLPMNNQLNEHRSFNY